MKAALSFITISTLKLLLGSHSIHALDPSLDITQYAHTAWTIREGFAPGVIHQVVQTSDGCLWLASAFRIAKAKQVEVEVRYNKEPFRLRVRDDSKGLDHKVLSRLSIEGHYGLPGMRERATLMGGKLTMWSEVDAGTEVALSIPGALAYATAGKAMWFSRKFTSKPKAEIGEPS